MLENMLYGGWTDEDDPPRPANLDRWFMDQVMHHAVRLWRGGQVDGSVWCPRRRTACVQPNTDLAGW